MYELDLLGVADAADRLGVSRSTVHRLVDSGELPVVGELGRRRAVVLAAADVDALAARRAARREAA